MTEEETADAAANLTQVGHGAIAALSDAWEELVRSLVDKGVLDRDDADGIADRLDARAKAVADNEPHSTVLQILAERLQRACEPEARD